MSDLGWRADGIERARSAGGIELEVYRRPGFAGGKAVRRASEGGSAFGFVTDGPAEDPWPEDSKRRANGER